MILSRFLFVLFCTLSSLLFLGCGSDDDDPSNDPSNIDDTAYFMTAEVDGVTFESNIENGVGTYAKDVHSIVIAAVDQDVDNGKSILLNFWYPLRDEPGPQTFVTPLHINTDFSLPSINIEYNENINGDAIEYGTYETPLTNNVSVEVQVTEIDYTNGGSIRGTFSATVFSSESSIISKRIENGKFFMPLELFMDPEEIAMEAQEVFMNAEVNGESFNDYITVAGVVETDFYNLVQISGLGVNNQLHEKSIQISLYFSPSIDLQTGSYSSDNCPDQFLVNDACAHLYYAINTGITTEYANDRSFAQNLLTLTNIDYVEDGFIRGTFEGQMVESDDDQNIIQIKNGVFRARLEF